MAINEPQDPSVDNNQDDKSKEMNNDPQDGQITINADDYKAQQRRISNLEKKLSGKQDSNDESNEKSDNTVSKDDYNDLKEKLDKLTSQQNLTEAKNSLVKTAAADKISLSDEDIDFIVVQGNEERTKKNYEYVKSFKSQQTNIKNNEPDNKKNPPKVSKREGEIDFGAKLAEKSSNHDLGHWL